MLAKLATFTYFDTLNTARVSTGATLGILRPTRIVGLDITPVDNPDWTKEELQKLVQYQQQAGLFDDDDAREITTLRKLPFSFHYNYECEVGGETRASRHKVADWEAGALFGNCRSEERRVGKEWGRVELGRRRVIKKKKKK